MTESKKNKSRLILVNVNRVLFVRIDSSWDSTQKCSKIQMGEMKTNS